MEGEILQKLLEKRDISPVAYFPDIEGLLISRDRFPDHLVVINDKDFTAVPLNLDSVSCFAEHRYLDDS